MFREWNSHQASITFTEKFIYRNVINILDKQSVLPKYHLVSFSIIMPLRDVSSR